ncbi:MAG: LamG domain-containing protein, partial [Gammaproteobacteria bacterium]|nr:LamG domain-containing protein [Gammaproteobacteria bacterium]
MLKLSLKFLILAWLVFQVSGAMAATVSVRVAAGNDDAEERISDGDMYRDSTDLEMSYDSYHGGLQIVGMRFTNVAIPQGATINSAYIEFETDETDSGTANLVIYGEDNDTSNQFANNSGNISSRTPTSASVNWNPSAWNSVNELHQTPDIGSIIKEIVDRPGWSSGNNLVIMIGPGTGCTNSNCQRTAESREGESAAAPLLVVNYSTGGLSCETYRDNFSSTSYSNQDGSMNWSGNWLETNDNGSPNSGDIRIAGNRLEIKDDNRSITRAADLSSYTTATLTFDYQESSFDSASDYVDVEVRQGGGSWTNLQRFSGSSINSGSASLAIGSVLLASDTEVRLITSNSLGNSDRFRVDNFQIEACQSAATPLPEIEWRHDELSWSGATDEVEDSSGNNNHAMSSVGSGLDTIATGQVCRAASFDGVDDYIDSNDIFDLLRTTATLSFWIRTTQVGNDTGWLAPGFAGVEQSGGTDDIFWGWLDASGRIGISVGDDYSSKSTVSINNGVYRHVVLSRNATSGDYKIYIDGALDSSGTVASGIIGTGFSSIGQIEDTGGSPEYFQGDLDEVLIFDSILSDTNVASIYTNQLAGNNFDGSARTCPVASADHFSIGHDGFAINCLAENITLSAHTATVSPAHVVDTTYSGTVNLTTSSANGDWSYVSGGSAARLTNNGNGSASYQFDGSENGQVVLALFNTVDETISINAGDGTISETSGAADASDDPLLDFDLAGFQFLGGGVVNNIGTQIAGKPSNNGYGDQTLQLQAWNTNQSTFACEAVFNSAPISVDFTLECVNPGSCQRPIYIGSSSPSDQVTSLTSVDLDFSGTTESLADFVLNYPDAGQIRLHAQHTLANGEVLQGSSLPFVSRPFGFGVAIAGNPDPAATDHTGTIFTTAGTSFQINIAAALWDGTDAGADGIPDNHDNNDPSDNDSLENNTVTLGGTNYTGAPNFGLEGESVTLSAILIEPFVSAYPDADFPSQTVSSFSSGSASTTTASFNDVGVIEIRAAITDGDYLGITSSETSRMISKSGYVGRFIPAFFQITPENGMFANTCVPVSGTPFTYIGQSFGYDVIRPAFVVSAMNALATPTITQNYTGLWAKLSDSSVSLLSPTSDSTQSGFDAITPMAVTYTQDLGFYGITDNGNGTLNFEFGDDQFVYDKDANSEVSEFSSDIDLTISEVVDLDSVSTTSAFTLTPDPVRLRFGRIRMSNIHGSELTGLQMPMIIEYYTGGFYQINGDDSCAQFNNADVIVDADNLSTPGSSTISVTNPTAVAGDFGISLSAPGAGITG